MHLGDAHWAVLRAQCSAQGKGRRNNTFSSRQGNLGIVTFRPLILRQNSPPANNVAEPGPNGTAVGGPASRARWATPVSGQTTARAPASRRHICGKDRLPGKER